MRARAHLARAVALEPGAAGARAPDRGAAARQPVAAFAADIVAVTDARRQATLVLTQDQAFAQHVAHRTLKLNPATGAVDAGARGDGSPDRATS